MQDHDAAEPGRASPAPLERKGLVAAILLALAAVAYYPVTRNLFGSDDPLFFNNAQNVLVHPTALFTERVLLYFRPLFQLWITVLYALFRLEPAGYFVAAILLHALNGYLVWRIALRLLVRPVAALAAAVAFTVLYAHAEALMWVAAQCSMLVCTFALAMLLSHLDACTAGGRRRALRTAAFVLAMLCSKETGLCALAWLPLAEWRLHGWRACVQRASLRRYALIGAVLMVYLVVHPRVILEGFVHDAGATQEAAASSFAYATPARVLGASFWLGSPLEHKPADLAPWLGLLALLAPVAIALAFSRARLRDALFFDGLLLTAMVPSCSLMLLQANGSRLYYFPTVGAALALGLLVAVLLDVAARRDAMKAALVVLALGGTVFAAVHIQAIHAKNRRDFGPGSPWQKHRERFNDDYHWPEPRKASPGAPHATPGGAAETPAAPRKPPAEASLGSAARARAADALLTQLEQLATDPPDPVRATLASKIARLGSDAPGVLERAAAQAPGVGDDQARLALVSYIVSHLGACPAARPSLEAMRARDPSARIRALLATALGP